LRDTGSGKVPSGQR